MTFSNATQLFTSNALLLKQIVSYFPLRYYGASFFFAFALLSLNQSIATAEGEIIVKIVQFFHVSAIEFENGSLIIGLQASPVEPVVSIQEPPSKTTVHRLPILFQSLFIIFFLSIATTAKTAIRNRLRILSFGGLCVIAFVLVESLLIATFCHLGISDWSWALWVIGVTLTAIIGGILIDIALFTTVTIPHPTKITPVVKRNYRREYVYLAMAMGISTSLLYAISMFLMPDQEIISSYLVEYVHIYLWLNLGSIIQISYWVTNLIHNVVPLTWIKRQRTRCEKNDEKNVHTSRNNNKAASLADDDEDSDKPFSMSVLIPVYNEERIGGRCLESIDRAAAKYAGKVEIIFVNDGSTDGTESVVSNAISKLKYATGELLTIPNSGKGYALAYGLKRTSGDIVFRTDADTVIDEDAFAPMTSHFKDPEVGAVTGWVFPLEGIGNGLWLNTQKVLCANYMYVKRAQEVFDSILILPGSSTAFRRDALMKAGRWVENIFGEDGEITNRVARYGYREVFEAKSLVYSEHPETLKGLIQQRSRWGVAFYHSRGRNLRLTTEFRTPRSLVFFWNILQHETRFGRSMIWPYMAGSIAIGSLGLGFPNLLSRAASDEILWILFAKIAGIQLTVTTIQLVLYAYRLNKVKALSCLKYYPAIRLVNMILNLIVKPHVMAIMLSWSSNWKSYTTQSFKDLRKTVNTSVDPLYPSGIPENKPKTAAISILAKV
jgi:cellulose synthase/poly-beta-1,6-N-acetylglucosamine synthase-like glycosyltransferase